MHRAGNPIAHSRHVAQRPRLHALRSSIAIAVAALEGVSPAQARSAFVCVHACTRATHPVCSLSLSSPSLRKNPQQRDRGRRTTKDESVPCGGARPRIGMVRCCVRVPDPRCSHTASEQGLDTGRKATAERAKRTGRMPPEKPKASHFPYSSPQRTRVWRRCNVIVCGGDGAPSCRTQNPDRG